MVNDNAIYQKSTLDNGLRVITIPMPQVRSVSMSIYFGVGSRHEPKGINGVSHFIEHMLFKGTTQRPTAREITEPIEGVGGILNAFTGKENTVYWAKVASIHFARVFDILGDMILNSVFDPTELEKERRVIIEELHMTQDSPTDLVGELIDHVLWGDQPVGWDIGGSDESVGAITRDDLRNYMAGHYLANNAVVSVAGNITHAEVMDQIAAHFGTLPTSVHSKPPSLIVPAPKPRSQVLFKETEQVNLCLAYPAYSYVHPDRYVLGLLDSIIGAGMSSRLFLNIREEQGLAYSVSSFLERFEDGGAAVVYAGVDPNKIDDAIKSIISEIGRVREEAVPESELLKVKEYTKGRLLLSLDETSSQSNWYGSDELLLGRVRSMEEIVEIIDKVTVEDVQRVAKDVFNPQAAALAIVGPYKDETRFQKLLEG